MKAYASLAIAAPMDKVWTVVRDFSAAAAWLPGVATCRIEDNKKSDQVGCVRTVTMADGLTVSEKLLALSDLDHSLTYTALPMAASPIVNYIATVTLKPITGSDGALAELASDFDVLSGDASQTRDGLVNGFYLPALQNLQKLAEGV